jgi:Zn-dependent protease
MTDVPFLAPILVILSVPIHEFGHYVIARLYGYPASICFQADANTPMFTRIEMPDHHRGDYPITLAGMAFSISFLAPLSLYLITDPIDQVLIGLVFPFLMAGRDLLHALRIKTYWEQTHSQQNAKDHSKTESVGR